MDNSEPGIDKKIGDKHIESGETVPVEKIEIPKEGQSGGMDFAIDFFVKKYTSLAEKTWENLKWKELKATHGVREEGPTKFMLQNIHSEKSKEALFNEYRAEILALLKKTGSLDKKDALREIKFDSRRGTSFDQEAFDKAFEKVRTRIATIVDEERSNSSGTKSTH